MSETLTFAPPVALDPLAHYEAFCALPQNQGRRFELFANIVTEKPMAGQQSSELSAWLLTLINLYVRPRQLGRVTDSQGAYLMSREQGLIFMPDIGYISYERLPQSVAGPAPVPPDLAVEILSPSDSLKKTHTKALKYLECGTRLVWVVNPKLKSVDVYTPDPQDAAAPYELVRLGLEDTLSGGEVLVGFELPLRHFFTLDPSPLP